MRTTTTSEAAAGGRTMSGTTRRGRGRPRKIPQGIFVWRNSSEPNTVYFSTEEPAKFARGEHSTTRAGEMSLSTYTNLTGNTPRLGGAPTYRVAGVPTAAPAAV